MDLLGKQTADYDDDGGEDDGMVNFASVFVVRVVTYVVLGTAFRKFLNGLMEDILGVRRVYCLYSLLLTL